MILCDEDFLLGGRLNGDRREIDGKDGALWARHAADELASLPEVRVMTRTTVFGAYDGNTFGALERVADHLPVPAAHQPRQRLWKIVARRTVLAAGALERPIVFGGNDRPGVMLASAVRTYVNRFRVTPGRRTAVFTTCDDGWKTAFDLAEARVDVAAIVDARREIPAALGNEASRRGIRVMLGAQSSGCSRRERRQRESTYATSADARAALRRTPSRWRRLESEHRALHPPGRAPEWSDAIACVRAGGFAALDDRGWRSGRRLLIGGRAARGAAAGREAAASRGFRVAGAETTARR